MLGESVLTTAKRVGRLRKFGESIFTFVKRVGGLQKIAKSVTTCAKCVEASRSSESHFTSAKTEGSL